MAASSDPESELLVQRIIETLSFRYTPDCSPVGVLYWYDQHDFTAEQWRRIEERLVVLTQRIQTQRRKAEEMEA